MGKTSTQKEKRPREGTKGSEFFLTLQESQENTKLEAIIYMQSTCRVKEEKK